MKKFIRSGATVACLKETPQSIMLWDVIVMLGWSEKEQKYYVRVDGMEQSDLIYKCYHRRLEMARRDFLRQMHRHFGQQLLQIKQDPNCKTKWTGKGWLARSKSHEHTGEGVTAEISILRMWEKLNPQPVVSPPYFYNRFWARARKPTLCDSVCPTCSKVEQVYRASEQRGYRASLVCIGCGHTRPIEVFMNGAVYENHY